MGLSNLTMNEQTKSSKFTSLQMYELKIAVVSIVRLPTTDKIALVFYTITNDQQSTTLLSFWC